MDRIRNLIALVARVGIGVIFIAHGWQKFNEYGISGVTASFTKMGIPMPGVSAWFAATVELLGGAALIVGIGLPVVGVLIAIDMAGAFLFVHASAGLISEGGSELVIALGLAALYLGFAGGRYSLDSLVAKGRYRELVTA
ncbi:DoxX family protein [Kutzneria viridogrisea]|uniref:DoxX family protein n=2 Tax=Kutzneria TaxID=43356 RepID=W5WKK2_9PSEU|nr:DoxX family protein [Kutzneria albida]AHI01291.1 hypothetical protein KALB_7933 [Kutzneria albida DSM 43870]MBA8926544.1 putative oxidoreductase [Kutzneria viridogrisea]